MLRCYDIITRFIFDVHINVFNILNLRGVD
jgi:hypothetical protein